MRDSSGILNGPTIPTGSYLGCNDLKELTDTRYPGIPSNAAHLRWEMHYCWNDKRRILVFAKAIAGRNSFSWLQVNDNGSVTLYVSTLGKRLSETGSPSSTPTRKKIFIQPFGKPIKR